MNFVVSQILLLVGDPIEKFVGQVLALNITL